MKAKEDMNSTRRMNARLERRELDSTGLMDTENHHHQSPQGFFQINLYRYNKNTTKYDLDLKDHHSKEPT